MISKLKNEIWTIGHSTHSIEEFMNWLKAFSISQLADVRSLPGSNKFPWFNKERLETALAEEHIAYALFKKLGGRRRPNPNSRNTIWRNKSFRAYADYMETSDFKEGLEELKNWAGKARTAIMCSEAVWWRCHRSMIADALKIEGWNVQHIMGLKHSTEHPFTKPAKIVDGHLYYGEADKETR